jgi:hypothetical protein
MKITVVLVAVLTGVMTTLGVAEGCAASFEARWPVVPMREPTLAEMARLVAIVAHGDAKPAIEERTAKAQGRMWHCTADACRLVGSR